VLLHLLSVLLAAVACLSLCIPSVFFEFKIGCQPNPRPCHRECRQTPASPLVVYHGFVWRPIMHSDTMSGTGLHWCLSFSTPVKHLQNRPVCRLLLLCLTFVLLRCTAFDRETGKAKGFAHIQFDSLESAAKALKLSGQDFGGREIFLDTAQERTGGGGGGGAAGGFGGGERPQRSEHCMRLVQADPSVTNTVPVSAGAYTAWSVVLPSLHIEQVHSSGLVSSSW